MKEIWKDIKGYEGLYRVSNLGKVYSCFKKRILQPGKTQGYEFVNLFKNCTSKTKTVHRLVAEMFIPNPENKPQVDHINGNKLDNRVENLKWVTAKENCNNKNTSTKGTLKCVSIKKCKPVRCVDTGIIYYSMREASRKTGEPASSISLSCDEFRKVGRYSWEYLGDIMLNNLQNFIEYYS